MASTRRNKDVFLVSQSIRCLTGSKLPINYDVLANFFGIKMLRSELPGEKNEEIC